MKTIFTKNLAIVVLSLTSVISWSVIALNWSKIWPARKSPPRGYAATPTGSDTEAYHKTMVLGAIRAKASELQKCYDAYLFTHPEVKSGFIRVNWNIDAYGTVQSVSALDSQFDDPSFTGCVLENIRAWTFSPPPQSEPISVAHKFTFKNRAPSQLNFE